MKEKFISALRWSEKYTKTDMLYLAKGGTWLMFGSAISSISVLLLAIAFANLLPKEVYGEYKYILSILSLLSIPTLAGMGEAITRAVARRLDFTPIAAIKIKVKFGLIGSVVGIALSTYYFLNGNMTLGGSLLLVSIFVPFFDTFSLFQNILTGRKLFRTSTYYNVVIQVISVLAMIVVIILTNNIFIILLTYLLPYTVLRIYFFKKTTQYIKSADTNIDKESLSFGKHLSVVRILSIIAGNLDKILLWHFLGAAPLAIYAFALAPTIQLKSVFSNVFTLAFPKLAQNNITNLKKTLYAKMLKFFIIISPIIIIYILVIPSIYNTIFPQYNESVIYAQLFAFILFLIPINILSTTLTAHAQKKKIYILNISENIVRVTLLVVLLPYYGIAGAIWALILSQIVASSLIFYLFKRM